MQFLGSLIFTTLLLVLTPLWGLVMFALFFVPQRGQFRFANAWARTLLWFLKVLCRLDYRVQGLENLPPGAHVAMWKHSSSWETIAQMVILPRQVWVASGHVGVFNDPLVECTSCHKRFRADQLAEEYATRTGKAISEGDLSDVPCPNCGRKNQLTPKDRSLGHQCDHCADAAEGIGGYGS